MKRSAVALTLCVALCHIAHRIAHRAAYMTSRQPRALTPSTGALDRGFEGQHRLAVLVVHPSLPGLRCRSHLLQAGSYRSALCGADACPGPNYHGCLAAHVAAPSFVLGRVLRRASCYVQSPRQTVVCDPRSAPPQPAKRAALRPSIDALQSLLIASPLTGPCTVIRRHAQSSAFHLANKIGRQCFWRRLDVLSSLDHP